jgi:DNA-binding winged helix-turn-helix (wHTH) protein
MTPRLEFDPHQYQVRKNGATVKLERHPMELLVLLLQHPGDLVLRETIAAHLWDPGVFVDVDQAINTAVRKIRRALDDPRQGSCVQTVVGKGYRFVGDVDIMSRAVVPADAEASEPHGYFLLWKGRLIPLEGGVHIIGRLEEATVKIDAPSVSRRHARIVVSEDGASIEDLDSKNGTLVNGTRIVGVVQLADQDVIQVGLAILTCRLPARSGSTVTIGI